LYSGGSNFNRWGNSAALHDATNTLAPIKKRRNKMKKEKRMVGVFTLAMLMASMASADSIAYNFTERWSEKTVQGEGTLYGIDTWTDSIDYANAADGYTPANSTDPNTITTPVNAPGVTVAWSAGGTYQAGDEGGALENQMFRVYLDDNGAEGVTISLTGLSGWLASVPGATGYEVTFYQNTDTGTSDFADINIYDGVGTAGTLLETKAGAAYDATVGNGSGSRAISSALGTFTADDITFNSTRNLGQTGRATVSGFSVTTIPEPATLGMVALFGGGILFIRRKRMF
jgi:hypothetical protein